MSGPSAIEKPRSPKIAVISSITWLIGWMRPRSAGDWRTGSVTSTFSAASRAVIAASFSSALRAAERLGDAVLQAVDRRALGLALLRRSSSPASSAARRPSPSCRARRRAPPRSPARRRPRRCRPSARLFERVHVVAFSSRRDPCRHLRRREPARSHRFRHNRKTRASPASAGFPNQSLRSLGRRWLRRQRFQKRSAWCSSDIRARPWPWRPARRKPAARGSPCRTAPCGRSRCRPCSGRR